MFYLDGQFNFLIYMNLFPVLFPLSYLSNILMKKGKSGSKNKRIDQLQLQITPISIAFNKKAQSSYLMYIQKGAQVLDRVEQITKEGQLEHRFENVQCKKFRIGNDKAISYQWSIYRLSQDQQQQYLQSTNFNIKNRCQEYIWELQGLQDDLNRIYVEKERQTQISQIWKDLRHDLTKGQFQMSSIFCEVDAKINFRVSFRCELDFQYERWAEQRQRKKAQRNVSIGRRCSVDVRNGRGRAVDTQFVAEQKQAVVQAAGTIPTDKRQSPAAAEQTAQRPAQPQKWHTQRQEQRLGQDLRQGQRQGLEWDLRQDLGQQKINILDPQGVDVTDQIPQNLFCYKRTPEQQYYYAQRKLSMLSDIIQESYEGSSNINLTRSNQAQRLKSVDQARQEEQNISLFSPLVKTQTFESAKHKEYFNEIKRTSTLYHKTSQEYEMQEMTLITKNKLDYHPHNFLNVLGKHDHEDEHEICLIRRSETSKRKYPQSQEQQKQQIYDVDQARKKTVKNVIGTAFIVAILILVANGFRLLVDGKYDNQDSYKTKTPKNKHKHKNKNNL